MKLKNRIQGKVLLFLMIMGGYANVFAQNITEELADFSELKVFNGVVVEVLPGEENRIEISGHSKDKVKFELVDNRLELRLSLENIWSDDNTKVRVHTRSLEVIDANEGSIVDVPEALSGTSFTFRAQEGAAVYAKVESPNISVKAITAGLVQLRGSTRDLEVDVNTGGKYFGKQLESENAEVNVGTGGQAEVFASEYAKATAKFGGRILLFGDPGKLDSKTTLGGKILERN